MNWGVSGIWGDENMPSIEELSVPFFGLRISPIFDLTDVIAEITYVRSATVRWKETKPEYAIITIETSLDGGNTWREIVNGGSVIGLDNDSQFRLRQYIRSPISDIFPTEVKLHKVEVTFSNKPYPMWDNNALEVQKWVTNRGDNVDRDETKTNSRTLYWG